MSFIADLSGKNLNPSVVDGSKPGKNLLGVFSPSAPLAPDRLKLGLDGLHSRGIATSMPVDPSVYYGKYDFGFSCDSAERRVWGLNQLLEDPEVATLLAVRGAYGIFDILPLIDFEKVRQARKILTGCSDTTALLLQWVKLSGVPAIHGPTLGSSFADAATDKDAAATVEAYLRMITDKDFRIEEKCGALRPGQATGPILAGNLTVLVSLLGTKWDVDYNGVILVIEDVGEAPYRIHRALYQLHFAGKLAPIAGLVFGRFAKCEAKSGPTIEDVQKMAVRDFLPNKDIPVLTGFPSGHWGKNLPLPLGCLAEIDGELLRTVESPLEA